MDGIMSSVPITHRRLVRQAQKQAKQEKTARLYSAAITVAGVVAVSTLSTAFFSVLIIVFN